MALTEDQDAIAVLKACGVDIDKLIDDLKTYLDDELSNLVVEGHDDPKPTASFQRDLVVGLKVVQEPACAGPASSVQKARRRLDDGHDNATTTQRLDAHDNATTTMQRLDRAHDNATVEVSTAAAGSSAQTTAALAAAMAAAAMAAVATPKHFAGEQVAGLPTAAAL